MTDHSTIGDFATAPSETLQDCISALGISELELSERTGLDPQTIRLLLKGVEPMTLKVAEALEKVLRVPAHFWLNLEAGYREHVAHVG
jgi:plasmid maintenance system antidote protein VapI